MHLVPLVIMTVLSSRRETCESTALVSVPHHQPFLGLLPKSQRGPPHGLLNSCEELPHPFPSCLFFFPSCPRALPPQLLVNLSPCPPETTSQTSLRSVPFAPPHCSCPVRASSASGSDNGHVLPSLYDSSRSKSRRFKAAHNELSSVSKPYCGPRM